MKQFGCRVFFFRKDFFFCLVSLVFLSGGFPLWAQEAGPNPEILLANDESGTELTPLEERKSLEKESVSNRFALTPHRPNYLLPWTWNTTPNKAYNDELGGDIDHSEVHFQISIKVPIFTGFWNDKGNLFIAYTNRSWWQAYNSNASSPFRETNHEPEIFLSYGLDWRLAENLRLANVILGVSHQSNGKGGDESRSWNRIYVDTLWELGDNVAFSIRPWFRIPEDKKDYPGDATGDDNPDIHNYMGYGDINLAYKFGKDKNQTLAFMLRNNLRFKDGNKGAVQVDWTFPVLEHVKLYVQYFNGYGESLLDYNASVNRIGVGFLLTDWL